MPLPLRPEATQSRQPVSLTLVSVQCVFLLSSGGVTGSVGCISLSFEHNSSWAASQAYQEKKE